MKVKWRQFQVGKVTKSKAQVGTIKIGLTIGGFIVIFQLNKIVKMDA